VILSIGTSICLAIIVVDIFGKTKNWKGAMIIVGLGIGSYVLGMLIIMTRNYFQGYYAN
jgi:hypothetical protein